MYVVKTEDPAPFLGKEQNAVSGQPDEAPHSGKFTRHSRLWLRPAQVLNWPLVLTLKTMGYRPVLWTSLTFQKTPTMKEEEAWRPPVVAASVGMEEFLLVQVYRVLRRSRVVWEKLWLIFIMRTIYSLSVFKKYFKKLSYRIWSLPIFFFLNGQGYNKFHWVYLATYQSVPNQAVK